jgi:hypothetical protein
MRARKRAGAEAVTRAQVAGSVRLVRPTLRIRPAPWPAVRPVAIARGASPCQEGRVVDLATAPNGSAPIRVSTATARDSCASAASRSPSVLGQHLCGPEANDHGRPFTVAHSAPYLRIGSGWIGRILDRWD